MVFGIMVAVLVWRVYQVLNPADPPTLENYPIPKAGEVQRPLPPAPPRPPVAPSVGALTRANPFWYYANPSGSGGDEESQTPKITLRAIQDTPTGPVATVLPEGDRLRVVREGDQLQTYTVVSISVEAGTVELFDEASRRTHIIEK